jgi:hypothetical protein
MAVQIIAWMVSGLYFSLVPIETVRGEHLTRPAQSLNGVSLDQLLPPARAEVALQSFYPGGEIQAIDIHQLLERTSYRVSMLVDGVQTTRLVDARTGELQPRLTASQAEEIATYALIQPAAIRSVSLLEQALPGSEYRGRALPLWQVSFDHPADLSLYIDAWTGELVARRTGRWRLFDFLWMLHIMDFDTRDDFNTPLLQVAAALGLIVALSGLLFWGMTTRLFRRSA